MAKITVCDFCGNQPAQRTHFYVGRSHEYDESEFEIIDLCLTHACSIAAFIVSNTDPEKGHKLIEEYKKGATSKPK